MKIAANLLRNMLAGKHKIAQNNQIRSRFSMSPYSLTNFQRKNIFKRKLNLMVVIRKIICIN